MLIDVQYLQKRGKAGWRYRRKVPANLRPIIGKREILIPLGATEAGALKAYPKVHAEVERMFAHTAAQKDSTSKVASAHMTALERYRFGKRILSKEWGTIADDDPHLVSDIIDGKYRLYAGINDDGSPGNERASPSDKDALALHALGQRQRPKPTLEDAKRLYLNEKVKQDHKKKLELERVFRMVSESVDLARPVDSLKREDAKETRDYMLDGGRTATTVDRYLNVVRAVINHAIKEYDLNCKNPFMGLEVGDKDKAAPDRDKRRPYTDEEVEAVRKRLSTNAGDTLLLLWRIIAGTGCRLAEVAGLRVEDVHLDHRIPHVEVEWHDDRRVKNKSSRRKVPLIGDALVAAQEAVQAAQGQKNVFPRYCREGGPASASAAFSKHVRAVVKDPKIGPVHSLRHMIKDKLILADVPKDVQDMLLGHTEGAASEGYGGWESRLEVAARALAKALGAGA